MLKQCRCKTAIPSAANGKRQDRHQSPACMISFCLWEREQRARRSLLDSGSQRRTASKRGKRAGYQLASWRSQKESQKSDRREKESGEREKESREKAKECPSLTHAYSFSEKSTAFDKFYCFRLTDSPDSDLQKSEPFFAEWVRKPKVKDFIKMFSCRFHLATQMWIRHDRE